jgi:hypothetical protein
VWLLLLLQVALRLEHPELLVLWGRLGHHLVGAIHADHCVLL